MLKKTSIILGGLIIAISVSFFNQEYIIFPLLIFFIGLFIGVSFFVFSKEEDRNFLLVLFFIAFLTRTIVSVFLYNSVFVFNNTGHLGDGYGYSESGYSIVQLWHNGIRNIDKIRDSVAKVSVSGNLGSYDFWNAMVYSVTGKSPLSVIFINCLAYSLTIFFIYYITKQFSNRKSAMVAAFLTAFWPSTFMWSIQNLKEPLSIFLVVVLIWAVVQLKIKFRFYLLFLIILSSIALKELRMVSFSIFYAAVFPISLILFLWKRNRVLFIFLIVCASLTAGILVNNYLIKTHSYSPIAILKYAYQMRTYRAYGNTAFLSNLSIFNPSTFIFFMPIMALVAWLAPFPWQIGSMSQISAVPEMLLYYLLLPAMFSGWKFIMKHKIGEGGIIIVYIFIMMIVLAFIEGNIGTLFRHRAMVLPFMFVLIGIGREKIKFKITAHS